MKTLEFSPSSHSLSVPEPTPNPNPATENDNDPDHPMQDPPSSDIPLSSPLRTHPKRLLPPTLSSTYPHGHISGHPRSPTSQAAFDARRAEILRTMSAEEIEKAYEEVAAKVRKEMVESERGGREVEEKMERLREDRETERKVWWKLRGMKGGD